MDPLHDSVVDPGRTQKVAKKHLLPFKFEFDNPIKNFSEHRQTSAATSYRCLKGFGKKKSIIRQKFQKIFLKKCREANLGEFSLYEWLGKANTAKINEN